MPIEIASTLIRERARASSHSLIFVLALLAAFAGVARAQTLQLLHTFQQPDGAYPAASVVRDRAGNLYGTTSAGGAHEGGTVFKLTNHNSSWVLNTLHSFDPNRREDGIYPTQLTIGPDGNLYGLASGGFGQNCCGVIYKLSPPPTFCSAVLCPWIETIVHTFTGGSDGKYPDSPIAFDAAANLYGTTGGGGDGNYGVAYKLTRSQSGWNETVLYSFVASDGHPGGPIVLDSAGDLYGATDYGGPHSCGNVFELTPSGSGWTESVLYSFQGTNDGCAAGGVIADAAGNLYGATDGFANNGQIDGTVYQLAHTSGSWVFNLLYAFSPFDGPQPEVDGLTLNAAGNLYGTTWQGGIGGCAFGSGCGGVFELSRSGDQWTFSYVHQFNETDGGKPAGPVVLDSSGNLYGATYEGGSNSPACQGGDSAGCGVVFQITP